MTDSGPSLADLVKKRREDSGYSQDRLAELVGCTRGAISQIESGETSEPTAGVFLGLKRALGIEYDTLFEAAGLLPRRAQMAGPPPLEQRAIELARSAGPEDQDWLLERLLELRTLLAGRHNRPKAHGAATGSSR